MSDETTSAQERRIADIELGHDDEVYLSQAEMNVLAKVLRRATRNTHVTITRRQYGALRLVVKGYARVALDFRGHRQGFTCECPACKRDRDLDYLRAAGIEIVSDAGED